MFRRKSAPQGHARWHVLAMTGALVWALILAGCGGSDPTDVVEPDPDVAPFVGDWQAESFVVTNLAKEDETLDITDAGSFSLNVQPSGFYTATLVVVDAPAPFVENGQLSVVGSSVRLSPSNGTSVTSSYAFDGPDRVELDGPTQFDFNNDGDFEAATAHIVLVRS